MSATDYCAVTDVKPALNIPSGDTSLDAELGAIISDVSRAIDDKTNRRFYPDADANQTRVFLPENSGRCVITDLCVFTSLATVLDPTDLWTLGTDFYLEPTNAAADGQPFTAIRTIARPFLFTKSDIPAGWAALDGRIQVTGKFGWLTVPGPVHRAAVIMTSRLFRRRDAPLGVVSMGIDTPGTRVSRLDPDVEEMLAPYALTWFA